MNGLPDSQRNNDFDAGSLAGRSLDTALPVQLGGPPFQVPQAIVEFAGGQGRRIETNAVVAHAEDELPRRCLAMHHYFCCFGVFEGVVNPFLHLPK